MKATITSFAELTGAQAERDRQMAERDKPKAKWFKIDDGEQIVVKFLQELDASAENYNPEFGTFLGAVEHVCPRDIDPKGFMKRALDTTESEGRDWAQMQHEKNRKLGWGAQQNFYINLAVQTADGVEAQIFSRKLNSGFVKDLVEIFEEEGGITGAPYVISRRGTGPQTELRIKPAKADKDFDISGVTPWDLNEYAVRHIPFDEQEKFYMRNVEHIDPTTGQPRSVQNTEESSSSSEDDDDYTW